MQISFESKQTLLSVFSVYSCQKRGTKIKTETNICQNRLIYISFESKETLLSLFSVYSCVKRQERETYICQKRPTYVKRNQKNQKRDQHLSEKTLYNLFESKRDSFKSLLSLQLSNERKERLTSVKETYIRQKRPTYVKREERETYICQKRPKYVG